MTQYIGAQDIGIVRESELREIIEDSNLNYALIDKMLYKLYEEQKDVTLKDFSWLLTIFCYGDTYFNYLQVPHVVEELERLKIKIREKGQQQLIGEIDNIISFLKKTEIGDLVRFIGD